MDSTRPEPPSYDVAQSLCPHSNVPNNNNAALRNVPLPASSSSSLSVPPGPHIETENLADFNALHLTGDSVTEYERPQPLREPSREPPPPPPPPPSLEQQQQIQTPFATNNPFRAYASRKVAGVTPTPAANGELLTQAPVGAPSSVTATTITDTDGDNETSKAADKDGFLPPDYYAPMPYKTSRPPSSSSTILPSYSKRKPGTNANTNANANANTTTTATTGDQASSSRAGRYGQYRSEEEYLTALRAWAREKEFIQPGHTTLLGFYGDRTMNDYVDPEAERRRKEQKAKKKEEKEARKRERATSSASILSSSTLSRTASIATDGTNATGNGESSHTRRKSSVSAWLRSHVPLTNKTTST